MHAALKPTSAFGSEGHFGSVIPKPFSAFASRPNLDYFWAAD
jgi:hypothetical protein